MERTLIYTAIIGPKDNIKEPSVSINGVDMVCLTNQPITSKHWSIMGWDDIVRLLPEDSPGDAISICRYFKLLPHKSFPEYDYWIWLDATYHIKSDPRSVCNADFGLYRHPSYGTVYREIQGIIDRKKSPSNVMRRLEKRYRELGVPDNAGLAACGALWRRNCSHVNEFDNLWWQEFVESRCGRDMPPFGYAAWRLGFKYKLINQDHTRNKTIVLNRHRHDMDGLYSHV